MRTLSALDRALDAFHRRASIRLDGERAVCSHEDVHCCWSRVRRALRPCKAALLERCSLIVRKLCNLLRRHVRCDTPLFQGCQHAILLKYIIGTIVRLCNDVAAVGKLVHVW